MFSALLKRYNLGSGRIHVQKLNALPVLIYQCTGILFHRVIASLFPILYFPDLRHWFRKVVPEHFCT
jgi:hypothetical protein